MDYFDFTENRPALRYPIEMPTDPFLTVGDTQDMKYFKLNNPWNLGAISIQSNEEDDTTKPSSDITEIKDNNSISPPETTKPSRGIITQENGDVLIPPKGTFDYTKEKDSGLINASQEITKEEDSPTDVVIPNVGESHISGKFLFLVGAASLLFVWSLLKK